MDEGKKKMTTRMQMKPEIPYRVRLRGGDGWKGNQTYVGTIQINVTPEGSTLRIVDGLEVIASAGATKFHIQNMVGPKLHHEEKDFRIEMNAGTEQDDTFDSVFVIHRDDVSKLFTPETLVVLGPPINHAANGIAAYALGQRQGGAGDVSPFKEETVPYVGTPEEREMISFFERAFFTGEATIETKSRGSQARALALTLIRAAVHRPGQNVNFYPLPSWMPSSKAVRAQLEGFLTTTGLGQFAHFSQGCFCLYEPAEGPLVYNWTRAREPFLASPEDMKISIDPEFMHKVKDETSWEVSMKEALQMTRNVMAVTNRK